MMDKLAADQIPNIRFNVAKSYAVLIDVLKQLPSSGTFLSAQKSGQHNGSSPKSQELIRNRILPNLEKLQQDSDVDVRYLATTATSSISEVMQA